MYKTVKIDWKQHFSMRFSVVELDREKSLVTNIRVCYTMEIYRIPLGEIIRAFWSFCD